MLHPILIVRNITREGPGLLETMLNRYGIGTEQVDLTKGDAFPDPRGFKAVVVLGGPSSANDETPAMLEELRQISTVIEKEIPYLGICLGLQTLVKASGGKVVKSPFREIGFYGPDGEPFRVDLTEAGMKDPLFAGLGRSFRVFQLHGETVEPFTGNTEILGIGQCCPMQAVRTGSRAYGLQCHFELTPELFESWLPVDDDLKTMDHAMLLSQFEEIREEYTQTGLRLMENFLRIAGVA
ncbi:MAG: type 1 glutamine amidotransferase [Chlorobiaceae bacterium]|nr:type 1 glutamine amidotransferase [Chlorobiaceae bacterium]